MKHLEKKLDKNYTKMLHDHLPPIAQTVQVRRKKNAKNCLFNDQSILYI